MALIQIREIPGGPETSEGSNGASSAQATISFDNGPLYPITISDPFTEKEESELEWYFEQYLCFPFTETVRAKKAADSITTYGEKLFEQIFGERKVYANYKNCLAAGLNTLQIEIAGSPSFQRWHWEALYDPELQQQLALQATIVRKNLIPQTFPASMRPSPTINVLVVVARPGGKQDVGYRTISRPLVESLRKTDIPVQIEILRPGTYRALDNHLRDVTARHGTGYYHVMHFDMHGAVLSYDQFQQGRDPNPYVYKNRYGRPPLQKYEGYRAFLTFEDEEDEQADLVEAGELAQLLITHKIPVAILNACQSGKQIGASETSLGSRLMQAGVQLVLAMGYSVTVSAAELLMRMLYEQLFDRHDLATAIRHARQELYNVKERRAYFDQTILLEDWLLPVVYQNQPQRLETRPFTPEEADQYYKQQAASYQPRQPGYGFVGRDVDILQIEKRVLTKKNILLIRGMGGAGKTTLLQHLGWWWQTTSFVEQVFYFGYDERAWSLSQILHAIARQLFDEVQYIRDFQPLSPAAQQAMLCKQLRAKRHVIILDNMESITGAPMAIQHTLAQEEQAALQRFLVDLMGGRCIVLLGSRSAEEWLAKETFQENVHDLGGLDREAASLLVDRILEKYGVTRYRKEEDLQHLIKLLDGFPLALEVVLANLVHQTPTEVLNALQEGDVNLNVGDSQERTENILRCIEYSHSNLSPEAQALLVCLAPFTSVLNISWLNHYTTCLKEQSVLATLPFERWDEVIQEAKHWGLLSADPDLPDYLRIQPTLPYFLRMRLSVPEQAEVWEAVETAFREYYQQMGYVLQNWQESQDLEKRQLGMIVTKLEFENLLRALKLALEAHAFILRLYFALYGYLDAVQDHRRGLILGQKILNGLQTYPGEQSEGLSGVQLANIINGIALCQLKLKQYEAAEASFQKALVLFQSNKSLDVEMSKKLSASVYRHLGISAEERRQWKQADQYYHRALQIRQEYNERYEQADIYHNLGIVAQEQRQWERAEQYYQQALQIRQEYNKRYEQAISYQNLGAIAQTKQQWEQAVQYYHQTLQIYEEYNDRYKQANIYHNLGIVAQQQEWWEQAVQYYHRALQIRQEYNKRYEQAETYYQLGRVAQEQGEWEQAEQYYQKALQIDEEYNDRYQQAHTYHQLGRVAQAQQQWEQARDYYLRSLKIWVEYRDNNCSAMALRNLALLWRDSGDARLPAAIAPILDEVPEEVETLLHEWLKYVDKGETSE
jgi:tetratricopeptide (TPR) repeat protein